MSTTYWIANTVTGQSRWENTDGPVDNILSPYEFWYARESDNGLCQIRDGAGVNRPLFLRCLFLEYGQKDDIDLKVVSWTGDEEELGQCVLRYVLVECDGLDYSPLDENEVRQSLAELGYTLQESMFDFTLTAPNGQTVQQEYGRAVRGSSEYGLFVAMVHALMNHDIADHHGPARRLIRKLLKSVLYKMGGHKKGSNTSSFDFLRNKIA